MLVKDPEFRGDAGSSFFNHQSSIVNGKGLRVTGYKNQRRDLSRTLDLSCSLIIYVYRIRRNSRGYFQSRFHTSNSDGRKR